MKYFSLIFVITLFILLLGGNARALAVENNAPTLILNFAQMNELPWSAPEEQWQSDVKPRIGKEILEMKKSLDPRSPRPDGLGVGDDSRGVVLGWSTLMEYMNFPMDEPSDHSPYVIKTRRILEIAEELDFPVFLPLNGFQWWDELPELYNWWDPDGTQTDPKFFARQDDPVDFKRRFIAGYDPSNKWNVEWKDPQTPMKLNYRNWGGGGFVLAPPPNLIANPKAHRTYRQVQEERLKAIVQVLHGKTTEWKDEGKEYLFVGLSIGTEISLNASATPRDEFAPYGFRSTADLSPVIPDIQETTSLMKDPGSSEKSGELLEKIPDKAPSAGWRTRLYWDDISEQRIQVVRSYLEENARMITKLGIPKELIYTHVLGEQDKNDPHYGGIAESAFNLYSNPGVSLYGYAKNPTGSKEWNSALSKVGNPPWGILEYNAGDSSSDWAQGLRSAVQNAGVTVIYNWDGLSESAKPVIKNVLATALVRKANDLCVSEKDSGHSNAIASGSGMTKKEVIQKGLVARFGNPEVATDTASLSPGIYVRFTQSQCGDQTIYSQPEVFTVPHTVPYDTTPKWVKWLLKSDLF